MRPERRPAPIHAIDARALVDERPVPRRIPSGAIRWIVLWAAIAALAYSVWQLTLRVERFERQRTVRDHGRD